MACSENDQNPPQPIKCSPGQCVIDITISHHQLPATMGNRPSHAYQHYPTPKGSKGGCPCGCNRWCNRCSSKWGWRCQHGNKQSCSGGGGAGPPFTKIVKAVTKTKKTVASVTTKTSNPVRNVRQAPSTMSQVDNRPVVLKTTS